MLFSCSRLHSLHLFPYLCPSFQGFDYSRSGNPTRNNFEDAVALLEGGKHGLAFSSGSATTATIINGLQAGSHVISVNDVYGGTYRYFTKVAVGNGVDTTFVDLANAQDIEPHFKPNTKVRAGLRH